MKLPEGWPTEISNEVIRIIALQYGFKLKEQPSGENDLNPYVYSFARKLINMASEQIAAAPTPPAQEIGFSKPFQWCSPGDNQGPKWLLFFDDRDRGYVLFTEESEAIEGFNAAEDRGWNCYLFALMQRTPAQENEPVGYVSPGTISELRDGHHKGLTIQPRKGIIYSEPLYTRPADDKLRKAAEEAYDVMDDEDFYYVKKALRAALEGKS